MTHIPDLLYPVAVDGDTIVTSGTERPIDPSQAKAGLDKPHQLQYPQRKLSLHQCQSQQIPTR